jgi:hypothetical protein
MRTGITDQNSVVSVAPQSSNQGINASAQTASRNGRKISVQLSVNYCQNHLKNAETKRHEALGAQKDFGKAPDRYTTVYNEAFTKTAAHLNVLGRKLGSHPMLRLDGLAYMVEKSSEFKADKAMKGSGDASDKAYMHFLSSSANTTQDGNQASTEAFEERPPTVSVESDFVAEAVAELDLRLAAQDAGDGHEENPEVLNPSQKPPQAPADIAEPVALVNTQEIQEATEAITNVPHSGPQQSLASQASLATPPAMHAQPAEDTQSEESPASSRTASFAESVHSTEETAATSTVEQTSRRASNISQVSGSQEADTDAPVLPSKPLPPIEAPMTSDGKSRFFMTKPVSAGTERRDYLKLAESARSDLSAPWAGLLGGAVERYTKVYDAAFTATFPHLRRTASFDEARDAAAKHAKLEATAAAINSGEFRDRAFLELLDAPQAISGTQDIHKTPESKLAQEGELFLTANQYAMETVMADKPENLPEPAKTFREVFNSCFKRALNPLNIIFQAGNIIDTRTLNAKPAIAEAQNETFATMRDAARLLDNDQEIAYAKCIADSQTAIQEHSSKTLSTYSHLSTEEAIEAIKKLMPSESPASESKDVTDERAANMSELTPPGESPISRRASIVSSVSELPESPAPVETPAPKRVLRKRYFSESSTYIKPSIRSVMTRRNSLPTDLGKDQPTDGSIYALGTSQILRQDSGISSGASDSDDMTMAASVRAPLSTDVPEQKKPGLLKRFTTRVKSLGKTKPSTISRAEAEKKMLSGTSAIEKVLILEQLGRQIATRKNLKYSRNASDRYTHLYEIAFKAEIVNGLMHRIPSKKLGPLVNVLASEKALTKMKMSGNQQYIAYAKMVFDNQRNIARTIDTLPDSINKLSMPGLHRILSGHLNQKK